MPEPIRAPDTPNGPAPGPARHGRSRLPLLAALLALVALVSGGVSLVLNDRDADSVAAGNETVVALEGVISAMKDVETGQRGYLLVGREEFLDPYNAGLQAVEERLRAVEALRVPAGLPPAPRLREIAAQRVALAESAVVSRRNGDAPAALAMVEAGQGRSAMDALRTEVASLQRQARDRVDWLNGRSNTRALWLGGISLGAALLACALLGLYAVSRRRAERKANALLDAVMTNAPIGLGFIGRDLSITNANRAMTEIGERMTGIEAGSPGALAALSAAMRARIEPRLRAVLDGGRAQSDVQIEISPADRPEEKHHLLATLFPGTQGADGAGEAAGVILMDITRRRRAEDRLRRSEARFRTLANALPQLAWQTDAKGEVEWYNHRWFEFTGLTADELKGSGWSQVHHPDHVERTVGSFRRAVAAGEPWSESFPMRGADGEYRWFLGRGVPIRDEPDEENPEGAILGWFGTNTDITDMREAQEEATLAREAAEDANRAKSQFIANMSHELRTPLSAVIGYSEMLEEEAADIEGGEVLTKDLQKIGANARHLLSLINDVLDLSKIEAGRMETHAEDFEVETLVSETVSTVQALMARKSNTLEVRLPPDLGTMHSDQVKLRQCLINLLSNASKFTEGGTVTLSAEPGRDAMGRREIAFRVSDTGIGMTQEQLSRLFTRFTQADSSTTRRFGGTGLGLAITKAFCTLLGGNIAVESEQGRGTTFTIRVPVDMRETGPEPEAEQPISTLPEGEAGMAGLVLVVDDDPASRELLSRFVVRDGFAVRCASDGEEGLRLAKQLRPTAILLDVMMPRMDGWSVLTALKADPELAEVPVVMVSIVQERALAVSLGAADYLIKPVQWHRLRTVLDRYRAPGAALVVEADSEPRAELRGLLESEGWTVEEAANAEAAMARIARPDPAAAPIGLVLVAVPGPEGDGLSLVHQLRRNEAWKSIQVIALAGGGVAPAELEALRGQVRQVLPADDEPPEALLTELRRITEARKGMASGQQGNPPPPASLEPKTESASP
ncbi:response regulator [Muricoccus pecuniae]|uniref:histidine kinase n=1 Tax=Muricoccus pecuniae TaxID=693023 RepID=A0A840Y0A0_9PROT|nr:response regulator [Roseomonas pecuniae]MBB5693010.1 PAS domain S-box-containing protein [Roseomonas pecuniae]